MYNNWYLDGELEILLLEPCEAGLYEGVKEVQLKFPLNF